MSSFKQLRHGLLFALAAVAIAFSTAMSGGLTASAAAQTTTTEGPFPVPYQNGSDGCNGGAGPTSAPGAKSPSPEGKLRVATWNIQSPTVSDTGSAAGYLDRVNKIADTLNAQNPDIVLLNEIACRNYEYPNNQARYLAERLGMPYFAYEDTDWRGLAGTVGVAILSKYPLVDTRIHKAPDLPAGTLGIVPHTATLDATIHVRGLNHRVFSTRLQPIYWHTVGEDGRGGPYERYWSSEENRLGHEGAVGFLLNVPPSTPVIMGGDFNAGEIEDGKPEEGGEPWVADFKARSGVTVAHRDPKLDRGAEAGHSDSIYYRGTYNATPLPDVKNPIEDDHNIAMTELTPTWSSAPVPWVVGRWPGALPRDATAALRAAGFAVATRKMVDSTCNQVGRVMSQNPYQVHAPVGSTVTIYVGSIPANGCP